MNRTLYFSGMQPTVEDLVFDQDSTESAVRMRIRDLFSDGVLRGLGIYLDGNSLMLEAGVAYVEGERIEIENAITIGEGIAQGFIFLKFASETSELVNHFITGDAYPTRRTDSKEVLVNPTDDSVSGGVLLAEIQNGLPIDRRIFMELKLSQPASCEPPAGLTTNTGFESDVIDVGNGAVQ
jgi:hypothetical protein